MEPKNEAYQLAIDQEKDPACFDPEASRKLLALLAEREEAYTVDRNLREQTETALLPRVRHHLAYAAASLSVSALSLLAPGMRSGFKRDFGKSSSEQNRGIFSRNTPFDR